MLKNERMSLIYKLVRNGKNVLDVGTDHAMIPIELVKKEKSKKAFVTDISRSSLEKGIKNIVSSGLSDEITAYCTDGTLGVPLCEVDDIIIAGMGGELIAKILSQDERLKNRKLHFILQPMSKPEETRKYLYENGFLVLSETKVFSENRVYPVISARFSGGKTVYSSIDLLLGPTRNKENRSEILYAEKLLSALKIRLRGLEKAECPDNNLIKSVSADIKTISDFLK